MEYVSALERFGVEDLQSSSGEQIEEDPEKIATQEDKVIGEDPEDIASEEDEEEDPEEIASGEDEEEDPEEIASEVDDDDDPNKIARKVAKEVRASRARMARRFGEIPGVPVGATWTYRKDCYDVGVHRHLKAGIQGVKALGACSIVVSGSYDDDKDFGDTILYTGAGGGSNSDGWPKRPGPQVRDQKWTGWGNEALRKSCDTGKPVRVVRSCKFVSDFSPLRGYRYDGLYTVTHACREKDNTGRVYICRYNLERVPGQPPLPRRTRVGCDIESSRSSPASVATSDTVVLPPWTFNFRKRIACSEDDPPIRANLVSKKRKLARRLSVYSDDEEGNDEDSSGSSYATSSFGARRSRL